MPYLRPRTGGGLCAIIMSGSCSKCCKPASSLEHMNTHGVLTPTTSVQEFDSVLCLQGFDRPGSAKAAGAVPGDLWAPHSIQQWVVAAEEAV